LVDMIINYRRLVFEAFSMLIEKLIQLVMIYFEKLSNVYI